MAKLIRVKLEIAEGRDMLITACPLGQLNLLGKSYENPFGGIVPGATQKQLRKLFDEDAMGDWSPLLEEYDKSESNEKKGSSDSTT